jgi:hypothetical protein
MKGCMGGEGSAFFTTPLSEESATVTVPLGANSWNMSEKKALGKIVLPACVRVIVPCSSSENSFLGNGTMTLKSGWPRVERTRAYRSAMVAVGGNVARMRLPVGMRI